MRVAALFPPARVAGKLRRLTTTRALSRMALGLVAGFVVATTAEPEALAYVRKMNPTGFVQYWTPSCLLLNIQMNGFTGMTRDEVAKSAGAAAHTWSPAAITCGDGTHPYMELITTMAPATEAATPSRNDGQNNVAFVNSGWDVLHLGQNTALAITSAWTRPDGRIVDADIDINADPASLFAWRNIDPGASPVAGNNEVLVDLQNVLTHEFGHVMGLDHTCFGLADNERMIDDMGNPVPDCGSAPDEIRQTTMFNSAEAAEVSKRVLSSDEVRATCELFPPARDPHACAPDVLNDGCGCAAAGDDTGAPWIGLAVLVTSLFLFSYRPALSGARGPKVRRA